MGNLNIRFQERSDAKALFEELSFTNSKLPPVETRLVDGAVVIQAEFDLTVHSEVCRQRVGPLGWSVTPRGFNAHRLKDFFWTLATQASFSATLVQDGFHLEWQPVQEQWRELELGDFEDVDFLKCEIELRENRVASVRHLFELITGRNTHVFVANLEDKLGLLKATAKDVMVWTHFDLNSKRKTEVFRGILGGLALGIVDPWSNFDIPFWQSSEIFDLEAQSYFDTARRFVVPRPMYKGQPSEVPEIKDQHIVWSAQVPPQHRLKPFTGYSEEAQARLKSILDFGEVDAVGLNEPTEVEFEDEEIPSFEMVDFDDSEDDQEDQLDGDESGESPGEVLCKWGKWFDELQASLSAHLEHGQALVSPHIPMEKVSETFEDSLSIIDLIIGIESEILGRSEPERKVANQAINDQMLANRLDLKTIKRLSLRYQTLRLTNEKLVHWVNQKYQWQRYSFHQEPLIGTLGLLRAARMYDPRRETRLATYATWWIRQGITRQFADFGSAIRVPVHLSDQVRRAQRARQFADPKVSYARTVITIPPVSLKDMLAITLEGPAPAHQHHVEHDLLVLLALLESIANPRSRYILAARSAAIHKQRITLESVGEKFALTRERIRQIEKKELDTISNGLVRNQEWIPSTVKEWFANESE